MRSEINKKASLESQYNLWEAKMHRLRESYIIETDPSVKFKLEFQIKEVEKEQEKVLSDMERLTEGGREEISRIKIYISSTLNYLDENLIHVIEFLEKQKFHVLSLQDDLARNEQSRELGLAQISKCEIFIGVIAGEFGYIPPNSQYSITELEYQRAVETGITRFMFLLNEADSFPLDNQIQGFRNRLIADESVVYFCNPNELVSFVENLVTEWSQTRLMTGIDALKNRQIQVDRKRREQRDRKRVVNLPFLDTIHTFKDRLREMVALWRYLVKDNIRLISIAGRGGMGKTALASYVLNKIENKDFIFEGEEKLNIDGIVHLSTRSTGISLERIYRDVGRMLGEPAASELNKAWIDQESNITAKVECLLEYLKEGFYIILLDNMEDTIDINGDIKSEGLRLFIEHSIVQPSGIKLILTSREQINLPFSGLHAVRNIVLSEGLLQKDAIALLRELDPEGTLGLQNASEEDLNKIFEMTKGIPRALEIIAGILYEDPTANINTFIIDRQIFDEQVLDKLIAESYSRLEDDARKIIEALSVFRRPVDETAIAYLLNPWFPGLDVKKNLRRLTKSYYVRSNRLTGEYGLHPLDQEFAYQQIPEVTTKIDESLPYSIVNLELRAASFYESIKKPESEWISIEDVGAQLAEFEHRVQGLDYDNACTILEPLDFDFTNKLALWGYSSMIIELRSKLVGKIKDNRLQASNLGNLGYAYRLLGQYEHAKSYLEMALEAANKTGDIHEIGIRMGHLGVINRVTGQIKIAIDYSEQALTIARNTGDNQRETIWLGHLATAYRAIGEYEKAIRLYLDALTIAQQSNDFQRMTYWLVHLGITYRNLGDYEEAIKYSNQALSIAQKIKSKRHEAILLNNLATIYYVLGQYDQSIELNMKALEISKEIGIRLGQSFQLLGLCKAYLEKGDLVFAKSYCNQALQFDMPENFHYITIAMGIIQLLDQDPSAKDTFIQAIDICRSRLEKTEGLCEERYALGTALAGYGVALYLSNEKYYKDTFKNAFDEYQKALNVNPAVGIIRDNLIDLRTIDININIEELRLLVELLENNLPDSLE